MYGNTYIWYIPYPEMESQYQIPKHAYPHLLAVSLCSLWICGGRSLFNSGQSLFEECINLAYVTQQGFDHYLGIINTTGV